MIETLIISMCSISLIFSDILPLNPIINSVKLIMVFIKMEEQELQDILNMDHRGEMTDSTNRSLPTTNSFKIELFEIFIFNITFYNLHSIFSYFIGVLKR